MTQNPSPQPTDRTRFFGPIRRLGITRSQDRWVGGVAGGLAERLNWNPLLLRGLLVLSLFFSSLGLLVYGLGWALLPTKVGDRILLERATKRKFDIALLGAGSAIIVGLLRADGMGWGQGLFCRGVFGSFFGSAREAAFIGVIGIAALYVVARLRKTSSSTT